MIVHVMIWCLSLRVDSTYVHSRGASRVSNESTTVMGMCSRWQFWDLIQLEKDAKRMLALSCWQPITPARLERCVFLVRFALAHTGKEELLLILDTKFFWASLTYIRVGRANLGHGHLVSPTVLGPYQIAERWSHHRADHPLHGRSGLPGRSNCDYGEWHGCLNDLVACGSDCPKTYGTILAACLSTET